MVGAVVGGGYNAWYMSRVGEWGYYTYRDLCIKEKERLAAEAAGTSTAEAPIVDAEVVDEDEDECEPPPSGNRSAGRE